MALLRQFPAFVVLMIGAAGLMLVPAAYAARVANWPVAEAFVFHGVFFATLAVILGLATRNAEPRMPARYFILTLVGCYAALPLMLGAPLVAIVPGLGIFDAYFEMLSCLTTTGASVIERPATLPEAVHLWRSLVGWVGGLVILVTAVAILAPLNLGGFELVQERGGAMRIGTVEETSHRILRVAGQVAPVYAVFTGLLALALIGLGDAPFVAVAHAMAALSTSGVSPVGGIDGTVSGRLGEAAIALFLLPAVSRGLLRFDPRRMPGLGDPQIQLMLVTVFGITLLLFLRSFIGAAEIDRQDNLRAAGQAIWGGLFTVLSFLTTTGFESHDWRAMQIWSDLPEPGTILLGVALMGGGIATTAGGVKLLRLHALYRHGRREMDLLVHPSSLGRLGSDAHRLSRRGPRIAFVFLMLYLLTLAALMLGLAATGLDFEASLALGIAALTTTGPAIRTLGDGLGYADIPALARAVLAAGMIVGRMEILVIIALFNPAYWR